MAACAHQACSVVCDAQPKDKEHKSSKKEVFLEVTKGRRAGVIGYQLLKDVVAAVPVA